MGNESRRRKKKKQEVREELATDRLRQPWIRMQTGLRVMAVASLILAIFVGWQVFPAGGLGQAVLYGGGFGASIWVIFYLTFRLNHWLKRH